MKPHDGNSHRAPELDYAVNSLVSLENGNLAFSIYQVLQYPDLLFNVAEKMARKMDSDDDVVLAMGNSGIPLGVAVGLVSDHRIAFFNRMGFPAPNQLSKKIGSSCLPKIPDNSNVVQIDSHIRSGYTSCVASERILDQFGIQPKKHITPLAFFDGKLPERHIDKMEYHNLTSFSTVAGDIASSDHSISSEELIAQSKRLGSDFWSYPPGEFHKKPYYSFRVPGVRQRPGWFLGLEESIPVTRLGALKSEDYSQYFDSSDEGIWRFFLFPDIVKMIFRSIGSHLELANYDYLIGVGHLGTAAAVALAYFNRDSFSGSIITNLGGLGLLPTSRQLFDKRVLPIQMRLRTGLYLVDTFLDVTEMGGKITEAIAVFSPPEEMTLRERMMSSSVSRLDEAGVSVRSVF